MKKVKTIRDLLASLSAVAGILSMWIAVKPLTNDFWSGFLLGSMVASLAAIVISVAAYR